MRARVDYSKDGGVTWDMWLYSASRWDDMNGWSCAGAFLRLLKLYPEWQFRLILGGGL